MGERSDRRAEREASLERSFITTVGQRVKYQGQIWTVAAIMGEGARSHL